MLHWSSICLIPYSNWLAREVIAFDEMPRQKGSFDRAERSVVRKNERSRVEERVEERYVAARMRRIVGSDVRVSFAVHAVYITVS
jgi:hypothetical protein